MEIDTWVGASGKNGMRRDWLLRSQATGLVFARATRLINLIPKSLYFHSIGFSEIQIVYEYVTI